MNDSPNPIPAPTQNIFWLPIAFTPIILIIIAAHTEYQATHTINGGFALWTVSLGVNPIVSIVSCCKMLCKKGSDNSARLAGGVMLGLLIAVINFFAGFFMGCLCSMG